VGFSCLNLSEIAMRSDLAEELEGVGFVASLLMDSGEDESVLRKDGEGNIAQVSGQCQGTLARGEGLVRVSGLLKIGQRSSGNPSEPVWVAQGLGEGLGALQADEDPHELAHGPERAAQVEAGVDGLRLGVWTRWQLVQRVQRLLERHHRLAIR
jgi:hypothetical protein